MHHRYARHYGAIAPSDAAWPIGQGGQLVVSSKQLKTRSRAAKSSPQATPEATQGSAYRVELPVYGIAKQRAVLGRAKGNGVGGGGRVYRGLFANKLGVAVINANVE